MSDQLREAAFRAFCWQTVEARAKELKDQARGELSAIPVGETVAARWGDRLLAKAAMAKGRAKLVVTDEHKLLAWVKANAPTELVQSVNPAWLKSVEARAKDLGLGAVISHDGDVIPGVEIVTSEPVVSVRKERDIDSLAIVGEIMSSGQLQFDPPKEIER